MSVYIGHWSWDPEYYDRTRNEARGGTEAATWNALMMERVRELRVNMPEGVTLLGSYTSIEPDRSVFIVEADNHQALNQISNHYWGVMRFEWVPAVSTPVTLEAFDSREQD